MKRHIVPHISGSNCETGNIAVYSRQLSALQIQIQTMKLLVTLAMIMAMNCLGVAQNYDENKVPTYTLPDVLLTLENKKITTAAEWENLRRKEVLYLFSKHVYGQMPKTYDSVNFTLLNADYTAMNGKAHMKHIRIEVWRKGEMAPVNVLLFLPSKAAKPVPATLFINNRGMDSVDPTRKNKSGLWPAEMLIDSGFAVAAFHAEDGAADNKDHYQEGALQLYPEQLESADGMKAIGAWAWAASRVMDYLLTEPLINPKRIAIVGHSRGGKAALWAGAQDQRFGYVFSNCSGNTGAALSRRMFGETVKKINTSFPYWFNDNYKKYNDNVNLLPVDQHMLLALMAPRPLYLANATDDLWADPGGTILAMKNAASVYALYNLQVTAGEKAPTPGQPVINQGIGYHIRTGAHDLTISDWTQFINFMKLH
jgi:(4-O-methyl)-D-glucuronate---lignin esterase